MGTKEQQFSTEVKDDYILLKTWGAPDMNNLDAPVNAALALAKEKNISKLLDDIRGVDTSAVSIPMQAKAMGIIWKLRSFKKVAMVMDTGRVTTLFFSTLNALNLEHGFQFKSFHDEAEAVEWLESQ
jgi:hypothetical protein